MTNERNDTTNQFGGHGQRVRRLPGGKPEQRPMRTFEDGQLAKAIYLKSMAAMKELLVAEERRLGTRDSEPFRYYKKMVMDQFYGYMTDLFGALEHDGLLVRCECQANIRQGYKPCPKCNGCGHRNSERMDDFVMETRVNLQPMEIEGEEDERQPGNEKG